MPEQDHAAAPEGDRDPPRAIAYTFPWALAEPGLDAACEELRACGIDAVQLALNYHVATFLAPRARRRAVRHGDLGGLCFDPASVSASWPFPPPVSPQIGWGPDARDVLAAAEQHGLRAIVWVVYLYQHALARRRPQLATEDAYGERSDAHLCPANAEVHGYVRALSEAALSLGRFEALHAEALAFHPFDHGLLNAKAAVRPGRRARQLLSLCFCRHCRGTAEAAGIAAEAFAGEVRRRIRAQLDALPDGQPAADGPDRSFETDLQAWLSLHEREVVALHETVFARAEAAGVRKGSSIVEGDDLGLNGRAPLDVGPRVDEVRFRLVPELGAAELAERIAVARRSVGPQTPTYAFLDLAHYPSEEAFADALALAHEQGVRHFRFYAYGLMSGRQLEWLREAQGYWT